MNVCLLALYLLSITILIIFFKFDVDFKKTISNEVESADDLFSESSHGQKEPNEPKSNSHLLKYVLHCVVL